MKGCFSVTTRGFLRLGGRADQDKGMQDAGARGTHSWPGYGFSANSERGGGVQRSQSNWSGLHYLKAWLGLEDVLPRRPLSMDGSWRRPLAGGSVPHPEHHRNT